MKLQMQFKKVLATATLMSAAAAGILTPDNPVFRFIAPDNVLTAHASTEYQSGNYKYTLENNKATIVGYTSTAASTITIPRTFKSADQTKTYSVVAIGNSAFMNKNLKKVTINNNIKSIGSAAFWNCDKLETVDINGAPTFSSSGFYNCDKLQSVTLSDSITQLAPSLFRECGNLQQITLPASLTSVAECAFQRCSALQSVTLPSGCQVIENQAFLGCTTLTNIDLSSVSEIGVHAFESTNLPTVTLNGADVSNQAFNSCDNLTDIHFSGDVKLGDYVFENCSNLSKIYLNSVNTDYDWGDHVFNNCPNLLYINDKTITKPFLSQPYFTPPKYERFFKKYFYRTENVGLVELYEDYFCEYVIEKNFTPDMSDLWKARVLHDWVIDKVDYDHDNQLAEQNHLVSSIFMNDTTVCEGYARGYAKLMNAAGIETYFIQGTDVINGNMHAWNLVNIDGNYYHVDCCWDDTENGPQFKYFLLTDAEVQQYLYHRSWRVSGTAGTVSASVLTLGDVTGDGQVTYADARKIKNWKAGKTSMTQEQLGRADLNLDGIVTTADSDIIEQYLDDIAYELTPIFFRQYLDTVVFPSIQPVPSWL